MVIDTAKIRRLMDNRELTQTRLAELSGLSRARIGSILKQDTAHVQAGTERRLARALGKTLNDLFWVEE